jgi:ABC-2 type transport system permease protein
MGSTTSPATRGAAGGATGPLSGDPSGTLSKALSGTWPLVRMMLRRDRVRLPVWLLAILATVYGSAAAVQSLYGTPEKLALYNSTMTGSAPVVVMSGPPVALGTLGGVTVYEINVTAMVAVALMAVFLVVRHTRGEEEAGRTELLASTVVGRHAPTAAALVVVGGATVAVAVGIAAILLGFGLPAYGSLAYGAAIAAFGLAFTGVGVCAAQVTAHARGALGLSSAFLGVAFALRAVGDVGSGSLSWFSPMGWVQGVRPFGDERLWPVLLLLAFTAGTLVLAAVLRSHRDVGAGLVATRAGRTTARRRLGTAIGLPARLQRGTLVGWAVGLFVGGLSFGSLSGEVGRMVELNEDFGEMITTLGGDPVDGFLGTMLMLLALLAGGFTVSSVLRLPSEETAGRAEPLLATGLSRRRWAAGGLAVTAGGTVLVLTLGGLGLGLAAAVALGEPGQAPRMVLASLAYLPATLTLAGAGIALTGWLPRMAPATWAVLAFCFVVGWLGTVLRFPD